MTQEQTLEQRVGTEVIIQLNRNPTFMELPAFLREHFPNLADNPTLTEIYTRAVKVSLYGKSAERYAQLLLARLKSYGSDLIYVAPETVRDLSREVVIGMIEPLVQKPILTKLVGSFEDVAKRVGEKQLNQVIIDYLSSINPPLPEDIFGRYREGGAASILYGEIRMVVQTPASLELSSGPYLFHAYDLSQGIDHYQDILNCTRRGFTSSGGVLFPQEVKAEGIYPQDEKASLRIGYFITKFEGGEVIDHGVPKGDDGKVPDDYCYAIVMTNTILHALARAGESMQQDRAVELSPQIVSLLKSSPTI